MSETEGTFSGIERAAATRVNVACGACLLSVVMELRLREEGKQQGSGREEFELISGEGRRGESGEGDIVYTYGLQASLR